MGHRPQALASIAEAVKIRRDLAAANPEAFLPDLAMSLINQANAQSKMGQRPQALASVEEAVKYYRDLAAANPDAFLPNLALSYGAWGAVLLAAEEPDAAAKFGEESASSRRLPANCLRPTFLSRSASRGTAS